MDVKLESLIEKIKKEGVEQAEKEAGQIIKEARAKAKKIVDEAEEAAKRIKEEAKKEIGKLQQSSQESLKQASRNLILAVRERLTFIFDSILKQELREALSPEALADMLKTVIEQWSQEKDESFEVLVGQQDKEKLAKLILSKFKDKAAEKIEIKSSSTIKKGFQIGIKGKDVYYDLSEEGIAEALAVFLNPFLTALISDKKDG